MVPKRICAVIAAASLLGGISTAAAAAPAHNAHTAHSVAVRAATSAFSNGSFETPTAPPNSFSTFSTGQTMGLWNVDKGSVDLVDNGFWQAAEGNQSVDLSGGSAGVLSQAFTTVPGTKYTVTYSLAGNPSGLPTVKTGEVDIDGQKFQDFTFDTTGKTLTNMGYVTRQFTFVANKPATTLTFASSTSTAYGPVIDDVQVKSCCSCGSGC